MNRILLQNKKEVRRLWKGDGEKETEGDAEGNKKDAKLNRLEKLMEAQNDESKTAVPAQRNRRIINEGEIVQRRRRVIEEGVVVASKKAEPQIEIERPTERTKTAEESVEAFEFPSEDEQDSSGVTETSESEDDQPAFIPKSKRQGKVTSLEAIEEQQRQLQTERLKQKQKESKLFVAESVTKAKLEEAEVDLQEELEMLKIDDSDDIDKDKEREEWKQREFMRISRSKDQMEEYLKEKEETERRRKMTDAELQEELRKEGTYEDRFNKKKTHMKFLQKYYHKGAFFADQEILQRDYTQPTVNDVDFEAMPAVMQKKNFGKRGQTRYTHLSAEDTSRGNILDDVRRNVKRFQAPAETTEDTSLNKKPRT